MGLARLPGTHGSEADGRESHGTAAAGRRGFRHVSQQEAGRLSALSRRGLDYAASDFFAGLVPRAARLSKSRDSGSLQPLPDSEVFCGTRPASRIAFYQVTFTFVDRCLPRHYISPSLRLHSTLGRSKSEA